MRPYKSKPEKRMEKHELTAIHLRTLVTYDAETGILSRTKRTCNRVKVGKVCGSLNTKGYLQCSIENRMYLVSHLIALYVTGHWPVGVIDHINGNKVDNRWSNLRDVTLAVNAQNLKGPNKANKTGYLGVSMLRGKYAANITANKKRKHLGCFCSPEQAYQAYITAKRQMHPGCTI